MLSHFIVTRLLSSSSPDARFMHALFSECISCGIDLDRLTPAFCRPPEGEKHGRKIHLALMPKLKSARPRGVWSDKIMNSLGLLFALLILVVLAVGVSVLGLAFSR